MTSNYPHLREAQRVVWTGHCTLSGHARAIAAYLLNRMSHAYEGAFPSVDRMADDMGWERKTIIKYTKEIVDSGLLERKAGRKGMYCYRVKDIDKIGEMLDAKLGEYVQAFWAAIDREKQLNGTPEGPVPRKDRSSAGTATGTSEGPRPVRGRDTERLTIKGQVKGQENLAGAPSDAEGEASQLAVATKSSTPLPPSLPELQEQPNASELHGKQEGVSWVEESQLPSASMAGGHMHKRAVWQDWNDGKVHFVFNRIGRQFYARLLEEEFTAADISQALMTCGSALQNKRKCDWKRAGSPESVVREWCVYAKEKRLSGRGKASVGYVKADAVPRSFGGWK